MIIALVSHSVYYIVPIAAALMVVWLIIDGFRDEARIGARTFCAGLLPVLFTSYIRMVRADWMARLADLPKQGIMAAAAIGAIGLLILVTDSSNRVFAALGISFAMSTMLLARSSVIEEEREEDERIDENLLHFSFGVAFALCLFGIFRLA